MDEIEKRLREASDSCVKFYQEWREKEHDSATREHLQDSIHELRKVASRLEIEMAVSEREEMASKPIPIPPHRAKRERNGGGGQQAYSLDDEDFGNREPRGGGGGGGGPQVRRSRRRPQQNRGGGNGGGDE